jgi:hypothetical protein
MPERPENDQKLGEEVQNTRIEIWQYVIWPVRALFIKKILFEERNVQNQMFMDSIKFYWRFNWIYGGFDRKKNWFLSQFGF